MSKTKQPPNQLTQILTQAVQTVQAKINLAGLSLKPGAKVPELRVYEESETNPTKYPLLGDRYLVGRSSKACDIVIPEGIVSQVHLSLRRNPRNPRSLILRDEGSTNGTFRGKRRVRSCYLYHGDEVSLGPPQLATAVKVQYYHPRPLWMALLRFSIYGVLGILSLLLIWLAVEWSQIDVQSIPRETRRPVVIYGDDGQTNLTPFSQHTHQELKKLSDFSPYLPKAVIASEDSRYYWHLGVDPLGILRAVWINLQQQEIRQGASTLTQQLARSLFPEVGRENTAGRKFREMAVALKLEATYSKDELLKLYLNRIFLGLNNFGFEDAARFYFDKSAADLTLAEAATLVAILPAPNSYNPVQDYDTAVALRNRVITRMEEQAMVNKTEAERARRSLIEISPKAKESFSSSPAPYFYSYVLEELHRILGASVAEEGNFIVETGLNSQWQKLAQQALLTTIETKGKQLNFTQGAIVSLDPQTGSILALVGGTDYSNSQFNRATQAQRQPGSTFKLFTFGAALEEGLDPRQTYSCDPVTWQGQAYRSCERSEGYIDMYRALAQSENAVAIRVAEEIGLDKVINLARRLGIQSPLKSSPGLVLGENEVNVLEITGAYGAIANEGVWHSPHAIERILDGSDCTDTENPQTCREIYHFEEPGRQALNPRIASQLTRMLQLVITEGTGRAAYLGLGEAGKTGTTDNYVDLWFIGYRGDKPLVTGIWLGNDDNSVTAGSSSQAAALWKDYMLLTLQ